jgi:hypothetical protein
MIAWWWLLVEPFGLAALVWGILVERNYAALRHARREQEFIRNYDNTTPVCRAPKGCRYGQCKAKGECLHVPVAGRPAQVVAPR